MNKWMSTAVVLLLIAIAAVAKPSRHRRLVDNERIFNGRYPSEGTYKYIVSLNGCGGVLISANWVVTAAHCLRRLQTQIVYGTHYKSGAEGGKRCSVRRTIPHPKYNQTTIEYDVALLELACNVTTDRKTAFATLATKSMRDLRQSNGLIVWTAGWGRDESETGTERLMHTNLTTVDSTRCQQSTSTAIDSTMLCAYSSTSDSCYGDSGGPLVYRNNDRWTVVGIVSFGTHRVCAQQDQPGVYHYIPESIEWIQHTTGISNDEQPLTRNAVQDDQQP